jgi:hypothetical protein
MSTTTTTLSAPLLREFVDLTGIMGESFALVIGAAEASDRTDIVRALLVGRQALADLQRTLTEVKV